MTISKKNKNPVQEKSTHLNSDDQTFQSDLEYEGYQTIEESDNDAFRSLDAERTDHPEDELQLPDRMEEIDTSEENIIDPQENKKTA